MLQRIFFLLAFLVAMTVAGAVLAQGPTTTAKAEAKVHFQRGFELGKQGAWSAALQAFLKSRELFPTPGNTRNAAFALSELKRHDEALDMLDALEREFDDIPAAEREAIARERARLTGLVGLVAVRTSDRGVTILIDGRERGRTPLPGPVRVVTGKHVIRAFKAGSQPFSTEVEVASGATVSVPIALSKVTRGATLQVIEASGIRGATVVVDGVVVGLTPWQGEVAAATHSVALIGDGSLGTQPAKVRLAPKQSTIVRLALEPLKCHLRIAPVPIGAEVALDQVDLGRGVWQGRVRCGPHRIEARSEGFLRTVRELDLALGAREDQVIELERDPRSPVWGALSLDRITLDLDLGFVVAPSLGGDLADSCAGSCSQTFPMGGAATLHAGYQWSFGLGVGASVGYVALIGETRDRSSSVLQSPGSVTRTATIDDQQLLSGVLIGAAVSLSRGQELPWLARLGAGVLVGGLEDGRDVDIGSQLPTRTRTAPARYAYVAPELRLGTRLGDHWEISAGVRMLLMFALEEPSWQSEFDSSDSGGQYRYPQERLAGSRWFYVSPSIGVRYGFF